MPTGLRSREFKTYFFTFMFSSKISHLILYRLFQYFPGMFITFIWREPYLRFFFISSVCIQHFVVVSALLIEISWNKTCVVKMCFQFPDLPNMIALITQVWGLYCYLAFSFGYLMIYILYTYIIWDTIDIRFRREHRETALHHSSLSLNLSCIFE